MKPQTLNVFGKVYRIEYKPLDDLDGECHNSRALIEVSENLEGNDLAHTILHEAFHAIFNRLSYYQAINHDLEELICDSFATFLVDNGLVKTPKSSHET